MASTPADPTPLGPLAALVGAWDVEVAQFPGARGRAVFEWIEGGAFLRLHAEVPDPAPNATWVVGHDDAGDGYTVLYHDTRGVFRVYGMSFGDGEWRMWRAAPGFHQRFTGTLSGDGTTVRGTWEKSPDGQRWEHDLDMVYTRAGDPRA